MKVFKPLAITKINDEHYEYSDGHDVVKVAVNLNRNSYSSVRFYSVVWPNGSTTEYGVSEKELYRIIERELLCPRTKKFTEIEFHQACTERGYLRGAVQVSVESLADNSLATLLIESLIETSGFSTMDKQVREYEIVGFEEHTLIIMVTVERKTIG